MVNYSNGKIYKIEPASGGADGDIYIGSTTKKYLSQRLTTHRTTYRCWKNGKYGKIRSFDIFEKYGLGDCVITLLENVDATSKEELLARERYYIQSMRCVNKVVPTRTDQEYRIANADYDAKRLKEYYITHKEAILKKQGEKITCDCGSTLSRNNLPCHMRSIKHQRFFAATAAAAEPANITL